MQSSLMPLTAGADGAPVTPGSSSWLKRLWALRAALGTGKSTRLRRMAPNRTRLLVFWALSTGAACSVAIYNGRVHQQTLAQQSAVATMATLEDLLQAVEQELRGLPGPAATGECSASDVFKLLQSSLASDQVRRFTQHERGADFACSPLGPEPAPPWTAADSSTMRVISTGQITSRLTASLRTHEVAADGKARSWLTNAELDERLLPSSMAARAQGAMPRLIYLTNSEGHRLLNLTREQRDDERVAESAVDRDSTVNGSASSTRYPLQVVVYPHQGALLRQLFVTGLWAAVAATLVVGMVMGLVWARAVRRARLYERIARGLRRRQFEPHVQPIVDLATGRCVGGEVLMRWHHPERGVVAPYEFIEEAERTGLIVGMSDLVMVRAAQRLSQLARLHPELYFSFNLTPQQLREPGFVHRLSEIFNSETLPQEQVLLELTERDVVDKHTTLALNQLHLAGWRVAIDDFGTGQSSLAALEQLRIDRIKIDRAFVRTIDEHTVKRPVLDAIITLADQLKVKLIAEGVETQSQWDYLRARGVQYAQGYLFAKPMDIDGFIHWLWSKPDLESSTVSGVGSAEDGSAKNSSTNSCTVAHDADLALVDPQMLQLWQRLRTPGGLEVRNRIHGLRTYANCFVGSEAVEWLMRHQRVQRSHAVQLGQRLLALGLIQHVFNEHDFKDARLYYRISADRSEVQTARAQVTGLVDALRSPQGPRWRQHSRGLLQYERCATGHEIIAWLAANHAVPRDTAMQWAVQLMRQGVLRHVYDDQPLRDDRSLYRLS